MGGSKFCKTVSLVITNLIFVHTERRSRSSSTSSTDSSDSSSSSGSSSSASSKDTRKPNKKISEEAAKELLQDSQRLEDLLQLSESEDEKPANEKRVTKKAKKHPKDKKKGKANVYCSTSKVNIVFWPQLRR